MLPFVRVFEFQPLFDHTIRAQNKESLQWQNILITHASQTHFKGRSIIWLKIMICTGRVCAFVYVYVCVLLCMFMCVEYTATQIETKTRHSVEHKNTTCTAVKCLRTTSVALMMPLYWSVVRVFAHGVRVRMRLHDSERRRLTPTKQRANPTEGGDTDLAEKCPSLYMHPTADHIIMSVAFETTIHKIVKNMQSVYDIM